MIKCFDFDKIQKVPSGINVVSKKEFIGKLLTAAQSNNSSQGKLSSKSVKWKQNWAIGKMNKVQELVDKSLHKMSDKDLRMLQNLSLDGNPVNFRKQRIIGHWGESADSQK